MYTGKILKNLEIKKNSTKNYFYMKLPYRAYHWYNGSRQKKHEKIEHNLKRLFSIKKSFSNKTIIKIVSIGVHRKGLKK